MLVLTAILLVLLLIAFIDDPAIFDGAHIAVQLIGRRLQEEKVLALAEHVGNAIHQSK